MKVRNILRAWLILYLQSPLEPDHLRKTIHNLSLFYTYHFELVFPPLNFSLLLYKQIRNLSLPSMPSIPCYSTSPIFQLIDASYAPPQSTTDLSDTIDNFRLSIA